MHRDPGRSGSLPQRRVARVGLFALNPRRALDDHFGKPLVDYLLERAVGRRQPVGREEA